MVDPFGECAGGGPSRWITDGCYGIYSIDDIGVTFECLDSVASFLDELIERMGEVRTDMGGFMELL